LAIYSLLAQYLGLAACLWVANTAQAEAYPFTVSIEKSSGEHLLLARNRSPAPVSVRLSLTSESNIRPDREWPLFAVIRPYSDSTLATIRPANRERGYKFAIETSFQPGNFHAIHDASSVYRLPFEQGRSFVVSQASDGPLSTHAQSDAQFAVDFTMPENTPILAARDGTVIEAEGRNKQGGKDRQLLTHANRIRILHADDSIASYAHLAPNGIQVGLGQKVKAGQVIGLSGSTGYSSGPHLHFAVHELHRQGDNFASLSVPIRFYVGQPPHVFAASFRQQVTADYTNPGLPPPLVNEKRAMEAR